MINVRDIVQVTNQDNDWFRSLVVVTEIKKDGIKGYTSIPQIGDAYVHLQGDDYEKVGTSLFVEQ